MIDAMEYLERGEDGMVDADDAIEALESRLREVQSQILDGLSTTIASLRDEAVAGRKESGIEDKWADADDAYNGIDDANRDTGKVATPRSSSSGLTVSGGERAAGVRSTVFLNLTGPYTDIAAARAADMITPTDDWPFAIEPTPLPETAETMVEPDMLAKMQAAITAASRGAETQIKDWLTECNWHIEVRKSVHDMAKLGSGVMKGPVPFLKKTRVAKVVDGAVVMEQVESIQPETKRIDPWNIFPDPSCGENIQDGRYIIERDSITAKQLKELIGVEDYLEERIEQVLKEGPSHALTEGKSDKLSDKDRFEIWYFYGNLSKEEMEAAGCSCEEEGEGGSYRDIPAIVTMINNTVIKATFSPLDSGKFPYDIFPWKRVAGSPFGTGIPTLADIPQRMLNAFTRNLMDNAALSGKPQIIFRKGVLTPQNGVYALEPGKIWMANEMADIGSLANAFITINIPSMQAELLSNIQLSLKMMEDMTGLPMLLQGQAGAAPDTVGGMKIVQANASVAIRSVAKHIDDYMISPQIQRYYEWIMLYGEDEQKGDYSIKTLASSAMVQRDISNEALLSLGGLIGNPAFGVDPKKWFEEVLKAQHITPSRIMMSEEDAKKQAEAMAQQQPQDPRVAIAQANNQTRLQIAQMEAQVDAERIRVDTDRDTQYNQTLAYREQIAAEKAFKELELKRELAMLEYANQQRISLESAKLALAELTIKTQTQKELAMLGNTPKPVMTPPTEPPQQAADGRAFEQ